MGLVCLLSGCSAPVRQAVWPSGTERCARGCADEFPVRGKAEIVELMNHPIVLQRARLLAQTSPRLLFSSLELGERFRPMIEEELGRQGIPSELGYIPLIESRFQPKARGRSTLGLWQLTGPTARAYGLLVNSRLDERLDPRKSTRAAAAYLADLYNQFDDWGLAVAAYNTGPARVERALRRKPGADVFDLAKARLLPTITQTYLPKLMATALVAREPERFMSKAASGRTAG